MFGNVLGRKLAFLDYKNMDFKQSQNWHFSKRVSPWFRPKLSNFFSSFFLGKIREKEVLRNVLNRKFPFLDYKNMD